MPEFINRAIRFATEAHQRIDHRRKYSYQPYTVHLERVAKIVEAVTDDEEMIAAAWLHDVVEDTPATLDDIEREFNLPIASLVRELTDISKPGDGNRAERKAIDRKHLARASARAQTIKLADLIDNCKDITKHDARFAQVYLGEMEALLDVLTESDKGLMGRARKTMEKGATQLSKPTREPTISEAPSREDIVFDSYFKGKYNNIFTAKDIAEPLLSYDSMTPIKKITASLNAHHRQLGTVRRDGEITGFITRNQLGAVGTAGKYSRNFSQDQVLSGDAGFAEVIHVLTRHDWCFVALLGEIQGVINRNDINKPYMRMWLFGIITLTEIRLTELIKNHFKGNEWCDLIPSARLQAAKEMQQEKQRVNQYYDLIDCLQLADKGLIIINDPKLFAMTELISKSAAKKVVKQFQSLRNNLAHGQDISTYDWVQIARLSMRMLE